MFIYIGCEKSWNSIDKLHVAADERHLLERSPRSDDGPFRGSVIRMLKIARLIIKVFR